MLQNIKKKKFLILLTYCVLFIGIVLIGDMPFHIFLAACAVVTLVFCIIFYPAILGILGIYFFAIGNGPLAEKYLLKAIKTNSGQPTVYLNYAIVLMRTGLANSALEYLEKARNMNRKILTDQNISITIASCYLILGKEQNAVDTLEELAENYPQLNTQTLTMLGYTYFRCGKYEKAVEFITMALQDGTNATGWDNLGLIHYKTGNFEKAEECFKSALAINENMIESNFYLGEILLSKGEYDSALVYFNKAAHSSASPYGGLTPHDAKKRIENMNADYEKDHQNT